MSEIRDLRGAQDPLGGLTSLALVEIDPSGVIEDANDAYCDLVGRSLDALVGHSVLEQTFPEDKGLTLEAINAVSTPGSALTFDKRYRCGDGRVRWVRICASGQRDGRIVGHVVDITALMEATQVAAGAVRRLGALVEHAAEVIAVVGADGIVTFANPAGERMLGHSVEDRIGTSLLDLVHPDDLGEVVDSLTEAVTSSGLRPALEFRVQAADGSWKYLRATGNSQFDDPFVGGIVLNAHDVTETRNRLSSLVTALTRASEYRDPYTAGHQAKVGAYSAAIAGFLGVGRDEAARIELGGQLHDIGKIAVPAEILTRPGKLSPAERMIVESHAQVGYEILQGIDFAAPITDIVRHHHERLDGSGYPDGLAGDEILIGPRIVAVADVIDAVASHRPYRAALGLEAAQAILEEGAGKLYDSDVVQAAVATITRKSPGPNASLAQRSATQ